MIESRCLDAVGERRHDHDADAQRRQADRRAGRGRGGPGTGSTWSVPARPPSTPSARRPARAPSPRPCAAGRARCAAIAPTDRFAAPVPRRAGLLADHALRPTPSVKPRRSRAALRGRRRRAAPGGRSRQRHEPAPRRIPREWPSKAGTRRDRRSLSTANGSGCLRTLKFGRGRLRGIGDAFEAHVPEAHQARPRRQGRGAPARAGPLVEFATEWMNRNRRRERARRTSPRKAPRRCRPSFKLSVEGEAAGGHAAVSEAAAMGDRSENAEYIYGKKQLREIDRRIRYLSKRLDEVVVVDRRPRRRRARLFRRLGGAGEREPETRPAGASSAPTRSIRPATGSASIRPPLARSSASRRGDEVRVRGPEGDLYWALVAVSYSPSAGGPHRHASTPPFAIGQLDHLVLRVANLDRMIDFYRDVLGCTLERTLPDLGLYQHACRVRARRPRRPRQPPRPRGRRRAGRGGPQRRSRLATRPFDEDSIATWLTAAGVATEVLGAPLRRRSSISRSIDLHVSQDPEGNTVELKGPPEAPPQRCARGRGLRRNGAPNGPASAASKNGPDERSRRNPRPGA